MDMIGHAHSIRSVTRYPGAKHPRDLRVGAA